ncbi:cytochrome P450 [Streptomyces hygroscopicus subsp. hygroscopicus]|uniref:cytochrome P450 n=1 Tax=Streptomyces hygroscopicus TaxID=1912 RepID=UPI000767B8C2|nr:cytochrome P450 [Streptomyces hygroscopicus]MBW8089839.1 cytochrome P450 [Streptomyces hygroscopicus subsp. hygroscopicus]
MEFPPSELASLAVEPLFTRDFETRPAAFYARLRGRYGPVAPVDLHGVPVWLVLGYREVWEVLRDETVWKKDVQHWRWLREGRVPSDWPHLPGYQVSHLLLQDDQQRKATRAAVDEAIAPFQDPHAPQSYELAKAVSRHADELITFFADGSESGWADLGAQFARALPLMAVNRLFGFPVEQGDEVFMDSWRMVDGGPDAAAAVGRLVAATTELAAHKKRHPGDDLTTRLLAVEPALTVEQIGLELYAIIVIMSELVSHAITNSVLEVLAGDAGTRAGLMAGPVEELVNRVHIASPPWVNLTFRFPVADTDLGDFRLAAGDAVLPSIAAAHGDPMFATPGSQEASVSSRAHLAWGAGPHQCPGRGIADMIVTTAVGKLFERCDIELGLPVDQLPWRSSAHVRGLKSFPVRFRMRTRQVPVPAAPETAAPAPDPAPAAASDPAPAPAPEPATPAQPERYRSALWRFLAGLRRG